MLRRTALLAALMLAGCGGGGGGGGSASPPPSPPPSGNLPPVFTIPTTGTFVEGTDAFGNFTIIDPEGVRPTLLTLTGDDAAAFELSSGGGGNIVVGTLRIRSPGTDFPDYEWPKDLNRDNIYNVTIRASDGSNTTSQDIRYTVTNVVDTPVVTRIGTGFDELVALSTVPPNTNAFGTSVPDGSAMYGVVAERKGKIYGMFDNTRVDQSKVFLDLTSDVSTVNGMGIMAVQLFSGGSWGADYASGGLLVLLSNLQGDTELRQYLIRTAPSLDQTTADKATKTLILKVVQPAGRTGNRGGLLTFAGGGLLVGIGDGGGTGDPDGNAQNTSALLGKVLRINHFGDGFPGDANRNYMIPPDNPVVGGVRQEVWASGLRNPTHGAFDPRGLYTYILDAGEGGVDEVNRLPWQVDGVVNFGWPRRLGANAYNGGADDPSFSKPVAVYAPGVTTAPRRMSPGVIYWGRAESHQAEFIFGDIATDQLRSFRVQPLVDGQVLTTFSNITADLTPNVGRIDAPVSIVSDDRRDMFILDRDGEIFRYHKAGT